MYVYKYAIQHYIDWFVCKTGLTQKKLKVRPYYKSPWYVEDFVNNTSGLIELNMKTTRKQYKKAKLWFIIFQSLVNCATNWLQSVW